MCEREPKKIRLHNNLDCSSSPRRPPPKPMSAQLPSPSDERILVRCDGEVPEILSLPHHQLIPRLNTVLAHLSLPKILYASRLNKNSILLVPESKDAVSALEKSWSDWGRRSSLVHVLLLPPFMHTSKSMAFLLPLPGIWRSSSESCRSRTRKSVPSMVPPPGLTNHRARRWLLQR